MILLKKTIPQNDDFFSPDSALNNNPSVFEKSIEYENKNFEQQTFHETYSNISICNQTIAEKFIL